MRDNEYKQEPALEDDVVALETRRGRYLTKYLTIELIVKSSLWETSTDYLLK